RRGPIRPRTKRRFELVAISLAMAALAVVGSGQGNVARRAQYRGPVEQLLAPTPIPVPGGAGAPPAGSPLIDPVGFIEGYNRWEFWFEINKDLLLRSRDFRRREVLVPQPPGAPAQVEDGKVRVEEVRAQIAPAWRSALTSLDERVAMAAAIGLGRIGGRESLHELEELSAKGSLDTRRAANVALRV